MLKMYLLLILVIPSLFTQVFVISELALPDVTACQNEILLLGSNKNMAKVVDVILGATVRLECNFCETKDDFHAKIWYFRKRGDIKECTEVLFNMDNNSAHYKFFLTPSHTLSIHNFTMNDSGIYSCKPLNHQEESIFTYVVDGVFRSAAMPIIGKISEWQEYKRLKINPINEFFEKSSKSAYSEVRDMYHLTFRIMTSWENWGKCDSCGRMKGTRRKLGKCRIYPMPLNITQENFSNQSIMDIHNYYQIDDYHVACASLYLNTTFPKLSEILRNIPDFEATEQCEAICIPNTEGGPTGSKKDFKYKMTKRIAENSHITLTCPEVSLDSNVEWFKDKNVLNSTFRNNMADTEKEPHLTIDSYNSLYILHATKNEEAIYTCTVDGEKMQKIDIRVVSKSKILNQEFIRYSIYLGFVLSLTLTCYCAGMCVAWQRRSSFADPLNLKLNRKQYSDEDRQSLLTEN